MVEMVVKEGDDADDMMMMMLIMMDIVEMKKIVYCCYYSSCRCSKGCFTGLGNRKKKKSCKTKYMDQIMESKYHLIQ